jgi:hypothetical protein
VWSNGYRYQVGGICIKEPEFMDWTIPNSAVLIDIRDFGMAKANRRIF